MTRSASKGNNIRAETTHTAFTSTRRRSWRCISLQTKLGIAFSLLIIITTALLTFALFMTARRQLREDVRERLRNIASIAALQIDGDAHATLVEPGQENNAAYTRIKWCLQKIRDHSPGVRYIYTWRFNEAGELVFVVDAETNPEEISHIGDIYNNNDDPKLAERLAKTKGAIADERFNKDKWGIWLSGYAPFYSTGGKKEGIVGIDIAAEDIIGKEREFLRMALAVFACTIPLAMAMGWLMGRKLTAPITKLIIAAEQIIEGDLGYRVPISSEDEIGILAKSFNRMTQALHEEIVARGQEIEDRSRAEKELAELNEELEITVNKLSATNRELSEVAYIAAHDLKTPVRAVGSLASMIRSDYEGKLDKEAVNELNLILAKADKMNELLDGMLQYCRLERAVNACPRVDANEVVKNVISEISPPEKIEITIENDLPVIECEPGHAELLFGHLIRNAIKFMDKPKGLIKINYTEKNDFWQFSISDNGPGIEQRHFSKIFKLFQTLNSHDEVAGAGVGLPIAKKIVELYNGAIWIESQMGVGSTFSFAIPKHGCREALEQNKHEIAVG
jgi:signal transduction histidine kinase